MAGDTVAAASSLTERRLYLVRHGETVGESSIRYHGRNDVALSDLGRQQVAALGPLLRLVPFQAVVHSPLDRARESAQILCGQLGRLPEIVEEAPDLIEVDFGAIEGLSEPEIAVRLPAWYGEWKAGRASGFPSGETFAGFAARAQRAVDGLLARHPVGHLLVVAHKGILRRAVAHLLGLPAEGAVRLDPALGSLAVIAMGERERPRLLHWNLLPPPS